MINFDVVTGQNINKHNLNWPQIPNHPYRILIISDSCMPKIHTSEKVKKYQKTIEEY